MKTLLKIFLVIAPILITLGINAQDYSPILKNNISSFIDTNGVIKAIKIDTVITASNGELSYFYKTWGENNFECIKPNRYSWIGSKYLVTSFGKYIFFNAQNDSIVLIPANTIGQSWKMYQYPDSSYLEATVTKRIYSNFISVSDTVAYISIQSKDKKGFAIMSDLNKIKILISKNFGLLSTPNYNSFPSEYSLYNLIGLSSPKIGKSIISDRDIYNFDVGDEFHYDIAYSNPPNGSGTFRNQINRILDKLIINNSDTIIYTIEQTIETEFIDWKTYERVNTFNIDTIKENSVFSSNISYVPDEAIIEQSHGYSYALNISSEYNYRQLYFNTAHYSRLDSTCWRPIFTAINGEAEYLEGCGKVNLNRDDFPSQSHEVLVYYKKGSETWGTPLVLNSVQNTEYTPINLYPNPISNNELLNISINDQTFKVELFNTLGQLVLENSVTQNGFMIKDMIPGLYILKASDSNKNIYTSKLLIK